MTGKTDEGEAPSVVAPLPHSPAFCKTTLTQSVSVPAPTSDCFPERRRPSSAVYLLWESQSPWVSSTSGPLLLLWLAVWALECVGLCVLIGHRCETVFHLLLPGSRLTSGTSFTTPDIVDLGGRRGETQRWPSDQSLQKFGSFPTECLVPNLQPRFPLLSLKSSPAFKHLHYLPWWPPELKKWYYALS